MHLPDGFVTTRILTATGLVSAAGLGWALRRVREEMDQRMVPMMGVVAAFVFAAQMVNFPVLGGTSAHLLGGAMAAILMGPAAGIIIISSVLIIQALFGDGGVFALAANIFNMAVVAVLTAYGAYRIVVRLFKGQIGIFVGAVMAGWVSVVVSAICCGTEIALSGTAAPAVVIPAMGFVHMAGGIAEGLITAFVVIFVIKTRPELLQSPGRPVGLISRREIAFGICIALIVAFLISPLASQLPDGLEHVAAATGLNDKELSNTLTETPFADYNFPAVASPFLKTALAGVAGSIVVFAMAIIVGRITLRKSSNISSREPGHG